MRNLSSKIFCQNFWFSRSVLSCSGFRVYVIFSKQSHCLLLFWLRGFANQIPSSYCKGWSRRLLTNFISQKLTIQAWMQSLENLLVGKQVLACARCPSDALKFIRTLINRVRRRGRLGGGPIINNNEINVIPA